MPRVCRPPLSSSLAMPPPSYAALLSPARPLACVSAWIWSMSSAGLPVMAPISRAGAPATSVRGGTSRSTVDPAATWGRQGCTAARVAGRRVQVAAGLLLGLTAAGAAPTWALVPMRMFPSIRAEAPMSTLSLIFGCRSPSSFPVPAGQQGQGRRAQLRKAELACGVDATLPANGAAAVAPALPQLPPKPMRSSGPPPSVTFWSILRPAACVRLSFIWSAARTSSTCPPCAPALLTRHSRQPPQSPLSQRQCLRSSAGHAGWGYRTGAAAAWCRRQQPCTAGQSEAHRDPTGCLCRSALPGGCLQQTPRSCGSDGGKGAGARRAQEGEG